MGKTRATILESRAEVLRRVLQLMYALLTTVDRSGQGSGQGSEQGTGRGSRGGDSDTQRMAALLRSEGVLGAEFYNLVSVTITPSLSPPFTTSFSTASSFLLSSSLPPSLSLLLHSLFITSSFYHTTSSFPLFTASYSIIRLFFITPQHITFLSTLSHCYTYL